MSSRTPMKEDKRFILTVLTIAAVLTLGAFGRPPTEGVLGFLGVALTAFVVQSQWGAVSRESLEARKNAPPADP